MEKESVVSRIHTDEELKILSSQEFELKCIILYISKGWKNYRETRKGGKEGRKNRKFEEERYCDSKFILSHAN